MSYTNLTSWKRIESQADADALLKIFGAFHDGCIREAHLWTDHWVAPDLSMCCPGTLDNRIRFLVHRQANDPAAIELLFEEVTRFNLVPTRENEENIIFEATLLVEDGTIFWAPSGAWSPNSPDRDDGTWISARQLRWRAVDWLGEQLHYGPKEK